MPRRLGMICTRWFGVGLLLFLSFAPLAAAQIFGVAQAHPSVTELASGNPAPCCAMNSPQCLTGGSYYSWDSGQIRPTVLMEHWLGSPAEPSVYSHPEAVPEPPPKA